MSYLTKAVEDGDGSSSSHFANEEVVRGTILEVMEVELPEIEVEDDILELRKICSDTMKKSWLSS